MNPANILPRKLALLVGDELASGERIQWVGQTVAGRFARKGIPLVIFGIPWTAFALIWMTVAGAASWGSRPSSPGAFDRAFNFFPLFGVPFVLVGLWMLTSPYWMYRTAMRTAYFVTDRRAVILDIGVFGAVKVRSFLPEQLKDLDRTQRADGTGDIVITRDWTRGSKGRHRSTDVGFFAIREVKRVEELMRGLSAPAANP